MGQIGNMLMDAASVGPRSLARLTSDIPTEWFSSLARPGGQIVPSNHPAFVVGHLCLYPAKTMQFLGRNVESVSMPGHYEKLFSRDAKCMDDPECSLYPSKDELLKMFESSYAIAMQAVRDTDDASLLVENPVDSPMKKIMPQLGAMLGFYMGGHITMHVGQISAWRRMQGMPPG